MRKRIISLVIATVFLAPVTIQAGELRVGYGISGDRISDFVEYDPAFAIKFTIYRVRPGDPDIFGAQQYAPLMDVEIPLSGS